MQQSPDDPPHIPIVNHIAVIPGPAAIRDCFDDAIVLRPVYDRDRLFHHHEASCQFGRVKVSTTEEDPVATLQTSVNMFQPGDSIHAARRRVGNPPGYRCLEERDPERLETLPSQYRTFRN